MEPWNPLNPIRKWFATATLPVKVFMGISIISAVVVVNKSVVQPHFRKKRYQRAEEWANMILEQEEREGTAAGTNISYVN